MSDAGSRERPFAAPADGSLDPPSGRKGPASRRRQGKPRASLSLESILSGAIEMLDADGEAGLTLRGLAARLGGGVGSVYWYVKNKDELLSYASDAVVGHVLPTVEAQCDRPPLAALRAIAIALFEQMDAHPWAAAHLMHDLAIQENAMLFWEGLGQHLLRLELTDQQCFQGVSAIVNYVVGMGAQMAVEPPPDPGPGEDADGVRARLLDQWAQAWLARPQQDFPFSHRMAPLFRDHDDFEQFVGGLDLILAGLERQAGLA